MRYLVSLLSMAMVVVTVAIPASIPSQSGEAKRTDGWSLGTPTHSSASSRWVAWLPAAAASANRVAASVAYGCSLFCKGLQASGFPLSLA